MKNPFREILPPLCDFETFVLKTRCYPFFDKGASDIEKIVSLEKFYDYFEPQVKTYDFYKMVATVLYGGYDRRTPEDLIELIQKSISLEKETIHEIIRTRSHTLNPSGGITSIGYPGMGKTLSCLKIQSLFPLFHRHQNLGITQIPILKIDCPERGTTLQLAKNFLAKIDSLISTNYSHEFRNATEPELLRQMTNKAVLHYIGVMIIDECQNLKVVTERESEMTMRFLKFLNNEFKVPVVYVGTPQAEAILNKSLQTASRAQSSGAIKWDRAKKISESENMADEISDWDLMIESLWSLQVLQNGELTKELKDTYYKYSQGIYRLLVTLHMAAQRIAITNEWPAITPKIIELAANEEMYLTIKMVLALENKEIHILRLFEDLNESEKKSDAKSTAKKTDLKEADLMKLAKAVYPRIEISTLQDCVAQVLSNFPDMNLEGQASRLKELVDQLQKSVDKTPTKKLPAIGELIEITQNAKTSLDSYNLLRQAGVIQSLFNHIEL